MERWSALVKQADGTQRKVEVRPGLTIGRHPQSGLVLDDALVSRHHAAVVERAGRLHLSDVGSQSGTRIRSGPQLRRDESHPLANGMVVQLGETELRFAREGPPASAAELEGPTDFQDDLPTAPRPAVPGAPEAQGKPLLSRASKSVDLSEQITDPERPRPKKAVTAQDSPSDLPTSPAALDGAATPKKSSAQRVPDPPPASVVAVPIPARMPEALGPQDELEDPTVFDPDARRADPVVLLNARARVVLADELEPRIVEVSQPVFWIGREVKDCPIDHKWVSRRHARIVFAENRFDLRDADSKGGTYFGWDMRKVEQQEIRSEDPLRFGMVDALFVTDLDFDGQPIPPKKRERAAEQLCAAGKVTRAQLRRARAAAQEKRRHVGEMLILQRVIDPLTWAKAYREAEEDRGELRLWLVLGVFALVAAVIALTLVLVMR